MANPDIQTLTADTWTKVATAVTSGQIHVLTSDPTSYFYDYRETGDPAPTDIDEALRLDNDMVIESPTIIDVYVLAKAANGKIRVEL